METGLYVSGHIITVWNKFTKIVVLWITLGFYFMAASLGEVLLKKKELTENNRVKCESSTRLSFDGATLVTLMSAICNLRSTHQQQNAAEHSQANNL